jgi:spore maturation protein CgeB
VPLRDIAIVGPTGNTHISGSLAHAARDSGLICSVHDTTPAYSGPRVLRALMWGAGGRRPYRLAEFSFDLQEALVAAPPRQLLAMGQAPLTARSLAALQRAGIRCVNFSTDDPWNPAHRARWHLEALPLYDTVFTPRRTNVEDLRRLGCRDVRYLPFAYDDRLFGPEPLRDAATSADVLFVGGADRDRADFFAAYLGHGPQPTLVGGYWERYSHTLPLSVGQKSAAELRVMTAQAAVNLCLVRRANRDGHVMRSFEIPAVGGFMIAEDTTEHRELFGEESHCVLYFSTPEEAAEKSRWAVAHPLERRRMADVAHALITRGGHTYRHRLQAMLDVAEA